MRQVILRVSLKLLVDFNFSSVRRLTVSLFLFAMILFSVALNSTYELCTLRPRVPCSHCSDLLKPKTSLLTCLSFPNFMCTETERIFYVLVQEHGAENLRMGSVDKRLQPTSGFLAVIQIGGQVVTVSVIGVYECGRAVEFILLTNGFYVHMTVPRNKFLYDKTNRCINFPNLFWLKREPVHVSGSYSAHHQEFVHCTLGTGICHTSLKTAFEQGLDGTSRPCWDLENSETFHVRHTFSVDIAISWAMKQITIQTCIVTQCVPFWTCYIRSRSIYTAPCIM